MCHYLLMNLGLGDPSVLILSAGLRIFIVKMFIIRHLYYFHLWSVGAWMQTTLVMDHVWR